MSPGNNIPGRYYEDLGSRKYEGVSHDYAQMWAGHQQSRKHHEEVRAKFLDWSHKLGQPKVGTPVPPESGAIVIAGPGFDIANYRDLSPDIVDGMLPHYPMIIGADWSPDVLANFAGSLATQNSMLEPKIELARRDFSGGLSAKFHDFISGELEQVRTTDDLRNFMAKIKGEVGVDEIARHITAAEREPMERQGFNPRIREVLDVQEPLDFGSVTQGRAEVRFLTANMLLAGMFALTEKHVRDTILLHVEGEDDRTGMLKEWHRLIEDLNTKVATDFMVRGLELNPKMHIFAPTDVNTHYVGLDTFDRLDLKELRRALEAKGFKLAMKGQWRQDDRTEEPPHDHDIQMLFACANGATNGGSPSSLLLEADEQTRAGDGNHQTTVFGGDSTAREVVPGQRQVAPTSAVIKTA